MNPSAMNATQLKEFVQLGQASYSNALSPVIAANWQ